MDNIEEIKKFYELNSEELDKVSQIIFDKYTYQKNATATPFAIIVLGQPGAGKSGVMSFSENQFNNAIALDIDDLRSYYPKYDEVSEKYPTLFENITGKFASSMMQLLTPRLIGNKYNVILHKTRGDDAVIKDTIIPLKNDGYDIILRVMAVNELESKMSALERSLNERQKFGYCRWVLTKYHNTQYELIPELVDNIEKNKLVDLIEVYTRGKIPIEPILQYSSVVGEQIEANGNMFYEDGDSKIKKFNPHNYESSKDAVNKARNINLDLVLKSLDGRIAEAKKLATVGDEIEYFEEVERIANNITKSKY